jgi:prepilin-type N-terminal cleavage/methylation domain-containing protein
MNHAPQQGFTLLELVLVIVVVALASVSILGQFSQAGQSLLLNEAIQSAGQLAQERAEVLLAVRRDQGYAAVPTGTTSEVLAGNYAGYTRTVTVNEPPVGTGCAVGATCKEVLINVARGGSPRAGLTLMLVDY